MKTRGQDTRREGFVLVNALVLVAAMSAAAVFLLARAESGRVRLAATQEADALTHALDAFEALGRTVLDGDMLRGAIDSPKDAWARSTLDVALAQGRVSGRITDQQGLFNVNWLTDRDNRRAREGLGRLLRRIGFSPQKGEAIAVFVSSEGPGNRVAYRGLTPPVAPLGGPLLMLDQLATLPEIQPGDIAILRQHFAVLPGDSPVNLNTAGVALLAALLPELPAARLNSAVQRRLQEPYPSVEAFMTEMGLSINPEDPDAVNPARFSVGSSWFAADITTTLGERQASRRVIYRRESSEEGTQVEWRVSRYR